MSVFALLSGLIAVLLFALVFFVNRRIRASLAAPRVCESGVPDGLPWREVTIPSVRGKNLFGWFIAAGEGAPVLAIVHGWGGNGRELDRYQGIVIEFLDDSLQMKLPISSKKAIQ